MDAKQFYINGSTILVKDEQSRNRLDEIEGKIPSAATSSNQLADKDYVNSSVSTSTAEFRGTSEPGLSIDQFLSWANSLPHNLNDYVFWNTQDSVGNTLYKRYKWVGTVWMFEYDLNNSSFTSAQWAAINSLITASLVTKLSNLPTNSELQALFADKQDVITDLENIRFKANSAYQKPQDGIPKSDLVTGVQTSLGKADTAYQKPQSGIPKSDLSSGVQNSLDKADTAIQQHQDISGKADKDTDAISGNVAKFDENGNPVDGGLSVENIARKDGSYDTMSVGTAKNLEGRTNVTDSFFERTTGGDAEVANGLAQMTEVGGNSVKFNQLVHARIATPYNEVNMFPFDIDNSEGTSALYQRLDYNGDYIYCPAVVENHIYFTNVSIVFSTTYTYDRFYASEQQTGGVDDLYHIGRKINKCTLSQSRGELRVKGLPAGKHIAGYITVNTIDLTAIFGSDAEIAAALGITTAEITTDAGVEAFEAWLAENVGLRAYYPYNPGSILNVNMAGIETVGRNLLDPTTGKARIIGAYSDVYGNYYGITGTHGAITFTSDMDETSTITPDEDGKFLLEEPGELSVADAGADCCVFLWWDGTQTDYVEHKDEKTYLDVTHIYGKLNGTGDLVRVWTTGMPKIGELKDLLRIEDGAVVARRYVGERAYTSGDESETSVLTDGSTKTYYVLSTPEVYTDLVYQGSEYFDDGTPVTLPLNYNADNWGIERVLPLNTSEALATAKPELTCKYSIDAVETLNTHADEIEGLYDKNEELDAKKPNKTGDYPGMAVGSAKVLEGTDSKVEDFVFTAPQCADGIAKLNEVRGKSLVWNQLKSDTMSSLLRDGITTVRANGLNSSSGTTTGTYFRIDTSFGENVAGHKYLFSLSVIKDTDSVLAGKRFGLTNRSAAPYYADISSGKAAFIYENTEAQSALGQGIGITGLSANTAVDVQYYWMQIDLTLMFGAGNEPTTVAEFEAMFPLPYYAYNEGKIISNKTEAVEVTGRNQWDEEWLKDGKIWFPNAQGKVERTYVSDAYCCKNLVPVIGGQTYYFRKPDGYNGAYQGYINIRFADGELYDLGGAIPSGAGTLQAPQNAKYLYFNISQMVGGVSGFCINLSDPSFNGQYEPYRKETLQLNIPTITGKLNGEGESVVVFPDGLKSAGSVYDEIVGNKAIKRIGVVDLGSLYWSVLSISGTEKHRFYSGLSTVISDLPNTQKLLCVKFHYGATGTGTNDNTIQTDGSTGRLLIYSSLYEGYTGEQFKAAMSGVLLYYELAEPLVYELDEGVPETFQAYKGGTLKQLPENGSEPTTAPCVISVTYALDAVGILTGLPQNYISKESLQAMLTAMQSAGLFASYTMTFNATTGKYEFTFTANS